MTMTLRDRLAGVANAVGYAIYRARFGGLSLYSVLVAASGGALVYATFLLWRDGTSAAAVAIAVASAVLVFILVWASRQSYVVFRPAPMDSGGAAALAPEAKLHVRATGFFEVSDMRRYLVEVPTVLWTTELGEHVLAARVSARRVLGIGVPSVERGWWYVFVEPNRVAAIEPGRLTFGFAVRPALRVTLETDQGRRLLFLSHGDPAVIQVLLGELCRLTGLPPGGKWTPV